MISLVGSTGFVGGNLKQSFPFDALYHSQNIEKAFGSHPDLLVYAGVPAEKYLANHFKEKDLAIIEQAQQNIQRINPKNVVLISTIDVFKNPNEVDEHTPIDTCHLHPYGLHRYKLEQWVHQNYKDALIVRLPALFGDGLKKNFLFDFLNVVPSMLKAEKFEELAQKEPALNAVYTNQHNGFFKLNPLTSSEKMHFKQVFQSLGFTALNFTDSRNAYQFFYLAHLWQHIQTALTHKLPLVHMATKPLTASEVYAHLTGKPWQNIILNEPISYNFKTAYAKIFGGENGYIYSKSTVLSQIQQWVHKEQSK